MKSILLRTMAVLAAAAFTLTSCDKGGEDKGPGGFGGIWSFNEEGTSTRIKMTPTGHATFVSFAINQWAQTHAAGVVSPGDTYIRDVSHVGGNEYTCTCLMYRGFNYDVTFWQDGVTITLAPDGNSFKIQSGGAYATLYRVGDVDTDIIAAGEEYGLRWEIDHLGVMTISGKGPIPDYIDGAPMWRRHYNMFHSVVIEEGITYIGTRALSHLFQLRSVSIPRSVKSLGTNAFLYCEDLKKVTISEGLEAIGSGAFSGCSSLTSITIPKSVRSIGEKAFEGCSQLRSVNIPEGVTTIEPYTFHACALTDITFPESLKRIETYAFAHCKSLGSVTISKNVEYVGGYAFGDCTNARKNTCLATTPPAIGEGGGIWNYSNSSNPLTLYVPAASLQAYMESLWQYHVDIILPIEE